MKKVSDSIGKTLTETHVDWIHRGIKKKLSCTLVFKRYKRFLDGHLNVENDKQKWQPSLQASKGEGDGICDISVDRCLWKLQKKGVNLNLLDTILYQINVNCTWDWMKSDPLAGFWIHETLPYCPDLTHLDFAVFPNIKLFLWV